MFSPSSVVITLGLASSAFAGVFFTAPTATIGFVGGQPANITWQEDNVAPLLSDFGLAKASIYTGNSISQTSLQLISASIDVSTLSLPFTPDASIGPDATEYFIRFESLSLKDASDPSIPALAFSHVFTMSGMTGAFSAEVQSQIDGQSTAPIGGTAAAATSTGAAASTSAATAGQTTNAASTTKAASASSSKSATAKAAAASGSSAAVPTFVAGSQKLWLGIVMGVFGAVMGAAIL
ncbi:hypothetical protein FB451DRAFT_1236907 [Mycena latifolia]|nr:hypothetical protein FB451DRAFT_1236907 [Mycena latifolia]